MSPREQLASRPGHDMVWTAYLPNDILFATESTLMSKITDEAKAAQRARVIASDMTIYPDIQRKIEAGIKNDNLFEEIEGIMQEARTHFMQYVSDDIVHNTNILEKAFIDIVFANAGHIESPIW